MSIRTTHLLFVLLALPLAAPAASPARQDYQEAIGRTPDPARGAKLYVTCAGCHRTNGRGNLDGSVPLIAGQHFRVTVKQLTDYRYAGRWDPRMQHYADNHVLPDVQAIADVAGHIARLARADFGGTGRGDKLVLGRALYGDRCASCHGARGEGDAETVVPRIAGQHYTYTLRQLQDAVEGTRPSFPADHIRMLERFTRDELAALADAMARTE
jgi:cytochrome c553